MVIIELSSNMREAEVPVSKIHTFTEILDFKKP